MANRPEPTTLPEWLHAYFWEYDASRLTWEQSRHTIVLRLLQSGGTDAVEWLRERMGDEEIRAFLVGRSGRGLSHARLRFWAPLVGVPPEQVEEWIAADPPNPWHDRTHQRP